MVFSFSHGFGFVILGGRDTCGIRDAMFPERWRLSCVGNGLGLTVHTLRAVRATCSPDGLNREPIRRGVIPLRF